METVKYNREVGMEAVKYKKTQMLVMLLSNDQEVGMEAVIYDP